MTQAEIIRAIETGGLRFPPLEVESTDPITPLPQVEKVILPDLWVRVKWGERRHVFATDCRARYNPRSLVEAREMIRLRGERLGRPPLLVVPYLSEGALDELFRERVSGLDLCSNGVIVVPNELLVYRTGGANRFPSEGTIKNVYRRSSSAVARAFLAVPNFGSVGELLEEVSRRGGRVNMATVSKVVSALVTDLVVERSSEPGTKKRKLRLLQPDKLLDLLAEKYEPPGVGKTFTGKYSGNRVELIDELTRRRRDADKRVIRTGADSVDSYAVMAREPIATFYCDDVGSLVDQLGDRVKETERFANLRLLQTQDDWAYFDSREELTASPVQTYLELMAGDKRDRETAEQVRRAILEPLRERMEKERSDGPAEGEPA